MHSVSELARQLHNEAVALARMGRNREACEKLRSAIKTSGEAAVDPRTLKALWQIARADGDWPTALAAGVRASVRDPLDFPFTDKLVRSLRECPIAALVANSAYPSREMPAQPRTLSVIIVSQNDQRYAEVDAQYEKAFADWAHERIRISDATSMYDGYARGFEKSSGDIVVFSHDDIRFAVPDFAARLAETISEADIVGVAGTTKVSGPALLWSGHPHLHGAITHKAPADASYEGFDTERIPGFHLYDLDFSYRAHLAGARITIACDLALIHQSRGNFDAGWNTAQAAFAAKFPELNSEAGKYRHWYHVSLPDEDSVRLHYAKLFTAWELGLS